MGWPRGATEKIEIVPPDPTWNQQGLSMCSALDTELGTWLVAPVEHVGSTAVPGLAAKPIIDLQALVADFDCFAAIAARLRPRGWHAVALALDRRPWRRLLAQYRAIAGPRTCI